MIAGVADTHTALWHLFDDPRLSVVARAFIEEAARARAKIAVSSISVVEVTYLVEKGRLAAAAYTDLVAMAVSVKLVARTQVPDMPDRIIAATAVHFDVPILSRDRRILAANLKAVW